MKKAYKDSRDPSPFQERLERAIRERNAQRREVQRLRAALEKIQKELHSDCTEEGCSDLCVWAREALNGC